MPTSVQKTHLTLRIVKGKNNSTKQVLSLFVFENESVSNVQLLRGDEDKNNTTAVHGFCPDNKLIHLSGVFFECTVFCIAAHAGNRSCCWRRSDWVVLYCHFCHLRSAVCLFGIENMTVSDGCIFSHRDGGGPNMVHGGAKALKDS